MNQDEFKKIAKGAKIATVSEILTHSIKLNLKQLKTCSLLWLVIWCLTDAVQLLCAALLAPLTLHTDVVVHFLGLLFCDAHTFSVIPVGTQIAANVEPLERTRTHRCHCRQSPVYSKSINTINFSFKRREGRICSAIEDRFNSMRTWWIEQYWVKPWK